jgi:hypothetical protein
LGIEALGIEELGIEALGIEALGRAARNAIAAMRGRAYRKRMGYTFYPAQFTVFTRHELSANCHVVPLNHEKTVFSVGGLGVLCVWWQ